ncbi:hypothetical protein HOY82DRAFT_666907 [Tuber indicum]|nr:hypothetical protein HOY82DRAFT_666907 [Tuber indicum]
MADNVDGLHHLVALMKYASRRRQNSSPSHLNPSLRKTTDGIVDHHKTGVRIFPILDALAHISLSQKRAQVVAVALQLDSRRGEIRLTIAENQGVTGCLVSHLENLWKRLQALSTECAEQRITTSDVGQVEPSHQAELPLPEESPNIPPIVGLCLKKEIFRATYEYSSAKQMSGITKWWERLGQFLEQLDEVNFPADLEAFERDLYNMVLALSSLVDFVRGRYESPGNPMTDEEWEDAYIAGMMVSHYANLVLGDRHERGCEILARKLQCLDSKEPFPLRHAIEKLTSLPRHIDTLLGFADSPRLRPALQYRMFVSPIPKQTRTIKLPASQEEWKLLLKTACSEHDDDGLEASAVELLKMFGSEEWVCPVHCECGLIQYLQTKQGSNWDNVPAFGYIGVSKPSCSPCRIWMETFNGQSGPQFYTRGSDGKWYWPWGAPTVEESFVEEESFELKMAEKVLKEYRPYLVTEIAARKRRGLGERWSQCASVARQVLPLDQVERTIARAKEREQRSGGMRGFILATFRDCSMR